MKNVGIVFSSLVILSVFLPWITSYAISPEFYNEPINLKYTYGYSTGIGIFGLMLGIISLLMFYFERKLSIIPGYIIFFIALVYIFEISRNIGVSSNSSGYYNSSVSYFSELNYGIYLFLIGGFICIICGFKFLKMESRGWTFS